MPKRRMPTAKAVAGGFSARLVARWPERRPAAGPADDDRCGAADHGGAGKDGVRRSGRIFGARGRIAGLLLGRVWLAGQERLVDEEIAAFEQPRIGRHEIAGNQFDNVAGHQLVDRHRAGWRRRAARLPAPPPTGAAPQPHSERGLPGRNQRHADRDDGHDDDEARDVAGRRGQSARHQQDDDQRVAEAGEKLQPERRTLDGCSVVGSKGRQPRLHLCGLKARRVVASR